MKNLVILVSCLLLLLNTFAFGVQQSQAESERIERLVSLGTLWGAIKLFHPYLAYKDMDWDGALVEAIPKVQAAETSEAYAAAVQGMLDVLEDPTTRVIHEENSKSAGEGDTDGKRPPFSTETEDGIVVVTIVADMDGLLEKLGTLPDEFAEARGIVFDLRSSGPYEGYLFTRSELVSRLSSTPIHTPGQRLRIHSGFTPETGMTSGGYYSAFMTTDGERISPASGSRSRCRATPAPPTPWPTSSTTT